MDLGCPKTDFGGCRVYLDPPMYFLFGFGMVFGSGFLLGLPKRY